MARTTDNQPIDRSTWPVAKFTRFADAEAADRAQYAAMTAEERLAMMWSLAQAAYGWTSQESDGSQLSRHVERITRGAR